MKKKIFVVMPIAEATEDLWQLRILETARKLGWECVRADALTDPGFIVNQIYEQIANADLIIGEMSDRNPNVFYEIGFAHALGKATILLARSGDDLRAFDTQGFRHFLHAGKAINVRRILEEILPNIEVGGNYEPSIPHGKVLYLWPSPDFDAPNLEWLSRSPYADKQLDKNGGQVLERLSGIGEVISVCNTDEYWNWHPKQSIMCLLARTKALHRGDCLYLLIDGQSEQ